MTDILLEEIVQELEQVEEPVSKAYPEKSKMKLKDRIVAAKEKTLNAGYDTHEIKNNSDELIGTMFIKARMDYGFHIEFIHEPDPKTLAGLNGTITEMFYDLRNQEYWIKRNLKLVNFSVRNVDSIFPKSQSERIEVFNKLSTLNNVGLYAAAFKYLGARGQETTNMFGRFFHRLITDHSYYELLHKSGIRVTSDVKIVNRNGKNPMEILGLSKAQWKMVTRYNVPISTFDYHCRNKPDADKRAIGLLALVKNLEDEFGLEKIKGFVSYEFDSIYKNNVWGTSTQLLADTYNLPLNKLIRYIYFECDVSQGLSHSNALSQYRDYIRMSTEMGYVRFDRYPKFLRTAHDIAMRNHNIQLNEEELVQWDAAYTKNLKFESRYEGYKVFPPEKPEDLVKEGNVLGHCVGSYVNSVRKELTIILFLREIEDLETPLVTIEVKGNKIVQARGKMNNKPSTDQKRAINKFAKKFELTLK